MATKFPRAVILLLIGLLGNTEAQYGPPQYQFQGDPQPQPGIENPNQPGIPLDILGQSQPNGNPQQSQILPLDLFGTPLGGDPSGGAYPGQAGSLNGGSQPIWQGTPYQGQQQPQPQPQYGPQNQPFPTANNGIPSPQDIMDFIQKKYRELFPMAGSSPPSDSGPLFPLPDLANVSEKVPKSGFFYSFSPIHRQAMQEVREILSGGNSTEQCLDIAKALQRDRNVHPHLWFNALSMLANKNPELEGIHRVSPVEALPDIFLNADALRLARNEGNSKRRRRQGTSCITVDETIGADNGIENRLWYFRESIGVNAHHWYYHTMYPFGAAVREDRHGELFYYMHSSINARYNAERLSNGLARVQPISPLQSGVQLPGYNPHLHDDNSGLDWSSRPANLGLTDVVHQNDPNLRMNVFINSHILQSRARILQSVSDGFVYNTRNQRVPINNRQGVDILGDIVQSNQWSLNPNYYGVGAASGLHNSGHVLLAFQSDPQFRQRLPPGVMGDAAPAMRDILFYRWHATIEQIFIAHKSTIAPYVPTGGELPLLFPGIQVTGLSITPTSSGSTTNQVQTFWSQQPITLNRGLDFNVIQNRPSIQICAKQLDYQPFNYDITINNANAARTAGTARIFLAPRFDEAGNRFSMSDQRTLFFVLDTFPVSLAPGANRITRRSIDSTLTVPWAQSLQEINGDPRLTTPYCGCGWPRNMLLPKGTPGGMAFDLFLIVTNAADDAVRQTSTVRQSCIAAPLYCGISNQLYPDSKPMGYPFDRLPYSVNQRMVANLDEYVGGITNMATTQIQIRFTGQ